MATPKRKGVMNVAEKPSIDINVGTYPSRESARKNQSSEF